MLPDPLKELWQWSSEQLTKEERQGQRCILPIQAISGQDKLDKTLHLYRKPKNYETASLPYLTGSVYKSRDKFKTCCSEALLGIKQYVVFSHDKKRWYPKILHWLQASEHGICLGADLLLCTDDSISVFSIGKRVQHVGFIFRVLANPHQSS